MKAAPVVKNPTPVQVPVVTAPASPTVLTVVVEDTSGQPIADAQVSISPSDASGLTDGSGEIRFPLGSASMYSVTASGGGKTVTVPYYVGGATRLVVIPVYVESVEEKMHPTPWFSSPIFIGSAIVVVVLVAAFFIVRFFRRK